MAGKWKKKKLGGMASGSGSSCRADDEEAVQHIRTHDIADRDLGAASSDRGDGGHQLRQRCSQGHHGGGDDVRGHTHPVGDLSGTRTSIRAPTTTRKSPPTIMSQHLPSPINSDPSLIFSFQGHGASLFGPTIGDVHVGPQQGQQEKAHFPTQDRLSICDGQADK